MSRSFAVCALTVALAFAGGCSDDQNNDGQQDAGDTSTEDAQSDSSDGDAVDTTDAADAVDTTGDTEDVSEDASDSADATDAVDATDASETDDTGDGGDTSDGGDSGEDAVAEQRDEHVHIYVTNTCELSTSPTEIRVPRGQSLFVDWHNHSSSYTVDVWMSYGGGYTDLARGDTWDEPIEHCTNINRPYTEYADITVSGFGLNDSSCPGHRLTIYCD